ncbi:MAG: UDP-N-acetylmuramate dehydrogenase [Oscillospiraceae bacterium]|nr:UDP-N-acetylmuramate dehydrogenase [Oscillospiraceae bacterium]
MSELINSYKQALKIVCSDIPMQEQVKMSTMTSFKIGGTAPLLIKPQTVEQMMACRRLSNEMDIKPLWLGNGTNMLIPDGELSFVVIKPQLRDISVSGDTVTAGCASSMAALSRAALENSLTGLEFAQGIPGSVGGGVYMNAGAYGGCLADSVIRSECITPQGELMELKGAQHDFAYRHSAFMKSDLIVVRTSFKLSFGEKEAIAALMDELRAKRENSQPLDLPSAGSTFKRPEKGYAAALIHDAGLKGLSVGGAMVSKKHSGFIVNVGGATYDDVIELMSLVRQKVFDAYGVMLSPEVRILDREGKEWTF